HHQVVGSRLNLAPRLHPNLPARYSHCTSNKLTRPERAMRRIVRQANALGFTVRFDPIQAA
ncbi:hypothetical protein, partial [Mycobacterium sp.]|uniref:hypothetical protein n=1 Tax=Mycobacterium sp. TaxID=1785 RepID=UPI003C72DB3E